MATNFYEYINPIEPPKVIDCQYNSKIPTTGTYRRIIGAMKDGTYSRSRVRKALLDSFNNMLAGKTKVEQTASEHGLGSFTTVVINGDTLAQKSHYHFDARMNACCSFVYRHYERERYGAGIESLPKISSADIIADLNDSFDPELRRAIRKALDKRGKKSTSDTITIRGDKDLSIRYKFNYDYVTNVCRNGTFSVPMCDEILRFNNAAIRFEAVLNDLKDALEMEEKLDGTFSFTDY